jgi:hypothetical protein
MVAYQMTMLLIVPAFSARTKASTANSNDKTTQDNDAAMQKHSADKLEWETKKARNEPVGRCPTIPKMQAVYFQCHCAQFNCIRGGSGTCPDCKDNEENGYCRGDCDKCNCPCTAAYLVSVTCIVCNCLNYSNLFLLNSPFIDYGTQPTLCS